MSEFFVILLSRIYFVVDAKEVLFGGESTVLEWSDCLLLR